MYVLCTACLIKYVAYYSAVPSKKAVAAHLAEHEVFIVVKMLSHVDKYPTSYCVSDKMGGMLKLTV
jgi:hypothetical protein